MPKVYDELPSVFDIIQLGEAQDRARSRHARARRSPKPRVDAHDHRQWDPKHNTTPVGLADLIASLNIRGADEDAIAQLADALHAASLDADAFTMAQMLAALPGRRSASPSPSLSSSSSSGDESVSSSGSHSHSHSDARMSRLERRARLDPTAPHERQRQRRHICPTTILAGNYSPQAFSARRMARELHAQTCPWARHRA